jgi:hypothetical protein
LIAARQFAENFTPEYLQTQEGQKQWAIVQEITGKGVGLNQAYSAAKRGQRIIGAKDEPNIQLNEHDALVYAYTTGNVGNYEKFLKEGVTEDTFARYRPMFHMGPDFMKDLEKAKEGYEGEEGGFKDWVDANVPGAKKVTETEAKRKEEAKASLSGILSGSGIKKGIAFTQDFLKKLFPKGFNLAELVKSSDGGASYLETLKEQEAKSNLHTGGVIRSSGKYNLQKDEVVLQPKRFADGGEVIAEKLGMKSANGTTSIKIEGLEEFKKAVDDLRIKDIDKLTDIKIEGIDQLPESISIDTTDLPDSIKIDTTDLPTIKVDTTGLPESIAIDGIDRLRDISITGIDELRDVTVTVQQTGAVGAENADELARALENINSQIISLKETTVDDITIVNEKVDAGLASIPSLVDKQRLDNADLYRELNEVGSSMVKVETTINTFKQEVAATVTDFNNKLSTMSTRMHSIQGQRRG